MKRTIEEIEQRAKELGLKNTFRKRTAEEIEQRAKELGVKYIGKK